MSFFDDTSSWGQKLSENWAISSGASVGGGAGILMEAKIFTFHNLDVDKKKSFVFVSALGGARMEAKFRAGSYAKLLADAGGDLKRGTDLGGNPLSASPPEQVTVHRPFMLNELYMAVAGGASTGVDAGVVAVGVTGLLFASPWNGSSLFTISGAQIEAIIGVGINIYSLQGGILIGSTGEKPTLNQREAQDLRNIRRFGMRPHAGKM